MIQFNLLPDVKMAYIKAQQTRRLFMSISVIASGVAVFLLVVSLISVDVVQKKNLHDLNHDIDTNAKELQDTPQLSKVLTIQNQLNVLTSLHNQKPAANRLFGYLSQVTPSKATISNISVDFTAHSMSITGNANALSTINTFIDSLKFTTYDMGDGQSTKAFSSVVLSSFAVATGSNPASYTITLSYDPNIFTNTDNVTLTVPQTITTRSVIDQPSDLFEQDDTGSGQ
ncbi:MAG TPA: hypothetical protein VHB51_00240 [Candidatus Saccharimonadales bacterium]|nr:hypothetical protein [Candidatus Saccharimonadales bacterium]